MQKGVYNIALDFRGTHMKKLYGVLTVLLVLFSGYIFLSYQSINVLKETETKLVQETQTLKDELASKEQEAAQKDAEIASLTEEKKGIVEACEVWSQRTEKLQALLSN